MMQSNDIMDLETPSSRLASEFLTFGLLGKLLLDSVDAEQWRTLREEEVFTEIPFAGEQPAVQQGLALAQGALAENGELGEQEQLARLEADYVRLFVGPGQMLAPPWESTYFNDGRLLFQEETLQVRRWYSRFGLRTRKQGAEPDDHIALELRFLAHLAEQGLKATQAGDEAGLAQVEEAQRRFLQEHVLRWVPLWCAAVGENAHTDFYRGLGLLVQGAVAELAGTLGLEYPEVAQ